MGWAELNGIDTGMSYLTSLNPQLSKNIAYVGSFAHFSVQLFLHVFCNSTKTSANSSDVQSQIIAPSRFTTLVHCWTAAVQGDNDCWTELHCLSSNTLKVFGIVGWWWRPPPPRCAWRGRCQSSSAQWWRWDARHQDFQFFDFFHFCNYYNFFNYSCQPPYVSHPISKIVNVHHPYYSLLVIN